MLSVHAFGQSRTSHFFILLALQYRRPSTVRVDFASRTTGLWQGKQTTERDCFDNFVFRTHSCGICRHHTIYLVHLQTQLAQAIAGESQASFMAISPSDILSKFVGESEASMRDVFDKGKYSSRT